MKDNILQPSDTIVQSLVDLRNQLFEELKEASPSFIYSIKADIFLKISDCLYRNKEIIKEMTIAEIEKKLGYSIKIIKENNV